MLNRLLRALGKKPARRKKRVRERWERIGTMDEGGGGRLERVPPWVLKEVDRITTRFHESVSIPNKFENYYLKGKQYRYKLEFSYKAGQFLTVYRKRREGRRNGKRRRATVVAIRDDRVLLVKQMGADRYSLPGGAIKRGEPSVAAAARKLYEETGLNCSQVELQFSYEGRTRSHKVFRAIPTGHPQVKGDQLAHFTWWNGKSGLPIERHVSDILGQMGWSE